ncbi:hypothetical protein Htur_4997 (plasmid) [Haloterrigena turkmenica DSM 5511]|uniref:PrgI family protein n=2 Tax=Haloterrigena turkmenica TaxID=62320 RepID=D2S2X9_HALTV|nr:hypothetical protein Htur_4997 [Haloterrigena turkmenica DSM 5511]
METFPIAGRVVNTKLVFGLTAREAGEVLVVPFLAMGIAQSLGFTGTLFLGAGGIGLAIGILTLLVSPAGQRPISYARAAAEYYLGSNEYHNRRTRPEPETPVAQDVVHVRQAGLDIETIEAEQEAEADRR